MRFDGAFESGDDDRGVPGVERPGGGGIQGAQGQSWPTSPREKAGWLLFAILLAGLGILNAVPHATVSAVLLAAAAALVGAALCVLSWRAGVRLTAGDSAEVIVRTMFRTYRVPITQVVDVSTSDNALRIRAADGRRIVVTSVRPSQRDQFTQAITAATSETVQPAAIPPADSPAPTGSSARIRLIIYGAILAIGIVVLVLPARAGRLIAPGVMLVAVIVMGVFTSRRKGS
jgi:hypothetical protein